MDTRRLSVHEGPPLGSVLSAFLIAPWFLAAAGLVLLRGGSWALTNRYTPSVLAATHLVTIGFLMMTASAAVFQLLPVLSGHSVRGLSLVAPLVQGGFGLGALVLAAAFLGHRPSLFMGAVILLGCATGVFLLPTAMALWSPTQHKTILLMRYALIALAAALILGLAMAISFGRAHAPASFLSLAHPVWAFTGCFILWVGVAWQVLPMFQGVRPWHHRVGTWVAPALIGLAVGLSWGLKAAAPGGLVRALLLAIAGIVGLSAAFILRRLWSRGRLRRDAMTYFWYLALTSLIAACSIAVLLGLGYAQSPRWPLVFGVLALLGAAASFIDGMLYKIVPFLIWMALQRHPGRTSLLMQGIISERRMMVHFVVHLLALVVLLIAIFWRPVAPLAAVFLMAAGAGLGLNLALAALSYRRALRPLASV